jgi:hypothetical protein
MNAGISLPANGVVATAAGWAAHPFNSPEPAGGWAVASVLFVVLLFGWRQVINLMK